MTTQPLLNTAQAASVVGISYGYCRKVCADLDIGTLRPTRTRRGNYWISTTRRLLTAADIDTLRRALPGRGRNWKGANNPNYKGIVALRRLLSKLERRQNE